jgi:competence protein ComEC
LTFIDVGHGTSVLLQAPDGQTLLYDAGKMGDGQRSFQGIASVLWWEGIRKIDTAMISHGDSDHYNALEGVAKRFRIEQLATTQQVLAHPSPSIRRWRKSLERQGVIFDAWATGAKLSWGKATLTAMHPPPEGVPGSDNANSLCLRIEYAGRSILLPGDLESPGTQALIATSTTPIDLLMAPHHGSISQDPRPLIEWCRPRWIAISGSDRALAPKALAPYSAPNRSVWVTAREGAIRIEIDDDGTIRADHWASDRWNRLASDTPAR